MPVKIVIESMLDSMWGEDSDLAEMSDTEILLLVNEDFQALLDNAKFSVIRSE